MPICRVYGPVGAGLKTRPTDLAREGPKERMISSLLNRFIEKKMHSGLEENVAVLEVVLVLRGKSSRIRVQDETNEKRKPGRRKGSGMIRLCNVLQIVHGPRSKSPSPVVYAALHGKSGQGEEELDSLSHETLAQTRTNGHDQRVLMQECHVKWGLGTRAVLWSEGARPVTVLRNGKEVLIHSPVRLIGKRAKISLA